eukprot:1144784-Pelagomonas_calceolata.AAC.5
MKRTAEYWRVSFMQKAACLHCPELSWVVQALDLRTLTSWLRVPPYFAQLLPWRPCLCTSSRCEKTSKATGEFEASASCFCSSEDACQTSLELQLRMEDAHKVWTRTCSYNS